MSPKVIASGDIPCLTDRLIDAGRYKLYCEIGRGGWGVVYEAVSVLSRNRYACKVLQNIDTPDRHQAIQREMDFHYKCARTSPGVLKFYKAFADEKEPLIYILMEYCEGGDLFEWISDGGFYGEDTRTKSVALQIIDALQDCHDLGVFHRDLKPDNILCDWGAKRVFLADFGFATDEEESTDLMIGSTPYMSPEVLGGFYAHDVEAYSTRLADIWALGITLVNIATGLMPWRRASYHDLSFYTFVMRDQDHLYHHMPISKDFNVILKRLFAVEPSERISLAELKEGILNMKTFTRPIKVPTPKLRVMNPGPDDLKITHFDSGDSDEDDYDDSVDIHISKSVVEVRHAYRAKANRTPFPQAINPNNHCNILPTNKLLDCEVIPRSANRSPSSCASVPIAPLRENSPDTDSEESEGPITPETWAVDQRRPSGFGLGLGFEIVSQGEISNIYDVPDDELDFAPMTRKHMKELGLLPESPELPKKKSFFRASAPSKALQNVVKRVAKMWA